MVDPALPLLPPVVPPPLLVVSPPPPVELVVVDAVDPPEVVPVVDAPVPEPPAEVPSPDEPLVEVVLPGPPVEFALPVVLGRGGTAHVADRPQAPINEIPSPIAAAKRLRTTAAWRVRPFNSSVHDGHSSRAATPHPPSVPASIPAPGCAGA